VSFLSPLLIVLLLLCGATAAAEQKESAPSGGGCLSCHEGIEVINQKMAAAWGADKRCEVCHGGQPAAATKLESHAGLIANPGDLRVIDRTCGKCHSDYGEMATVTIQGVGNHVGRVMRSLMATAAGEIAGTRYLWNAQETRSAIYGVRAVADLDQRQPHGAVERLRRLPPPEHSDADSLLRSACLRCHLWTEDKTTPGIYRPAGCAACHVPYAEDGLSRSGDPVVSKTEPGHPETHAITTKVSNAQCLLCHNDGGARIGLNYVGFAVANPSLGRVEGRPGGQSAYGATIMRVKPDVHFRRGLSCIDCHDTVDLHGDGEIYSHQEYQVAIRCESCHGSATEPPSLETERGRKLENVEAASDKLYLRTKLFNEKIPIPVLFPADPEGSGPAEIWHQGHGRLECYACHSERLSQCYGCHMIRDDRKTSPIDWVIGIGEGQPAEPSVGWWSGRTLAQTWDDPVLAFNRKDRVSPLMPGGQVMLTHIGSAGNTIKKNHTFTTSGGLYGFSMNPVQPHNISAGSRTCSSCHSSARALGLGGELLDLKRMGLPINFSPDRIVDEEGLPIQDSAHEGVRPFSREDLANLFRTETCIVCHEKAPERSDGAIAPPPSLKGADGRHHEAIRKRCE